MTSACEEILNVSKIKVKENGKSAIILNEDNEAFKKIKVDGCLLKNKIASDWVVSLPKVGDVVIELKGSDVDHAVLQVEETIKFLTGSGMRSGALSGLIVCSRYPRHDTKIQLAQQKIAKAYKAPLHVVTRNQEYEFRRLLAFDGPI